jgi:hypothetical protein
MGCGCAPAQHFVMMVQAGKFCEVAEEFLTKKRS